MIKYIKSLLWIVAKLLSYIEDARCLKVKPNEHQGKLEDVTRAWELPQRQSKAKKKLCRVQRSGVPIKTIYQNAVAFS